MRLAQTTLVCLALTASCSAPHAETRAATPATLAGTFARAGAGDTINLAAGAYGDVAIDRKFNAPVTLTCADPANPPSLRSLNIQEASNVTFKCLHIDFTPDAKTVSWSSAVEVEGSDHITFSDIKLIGGGAVTGVPETAAEMDNSGNVIGRPSARGMSIKASSDIVVEDSEIARFHRGILLAGVNRVTLRRNDLHDMRTTAIVGADLNDVVVDNNRIHDAHPWNWGHGDHADFIAFWSDAKQATPNARVQITNNKISQADGVSVLGMWFQGTETAPFTDAVISNNTFWLANLQGISLWNTRNVVIDHNIMLREPLGEDPKQAPAILLRDGVTGAVMTNNTLSQISDESGGKNPQKGNTMVDGKAGLAPKRAPAT